MKVSLLTIGDELLIGQVVDTNKSYIGAQLVVHDIDLVRAITVQDTLQAIGAGIEQARHDVDVVLLTGGLGPTEDDLTLEALAKHLQRPLYFDEATYARIEYIFNEVIKRPLSPSHRRQAMLPEGATTLENKEGTAPGVWVEDGGQVFVAMPGVPREMKYLIDHQILPRLTSKYKVAPSRQTTILTAGWGETRIADALASVITTLADNASIAYLPGLGSVRLRLTVRGAVTGRLERQLDEFTKAVLDCLPPELIVSTDGSSLSETVLSTLKEKQLRISSAESCSGGGISRLLTQVPGASAAFIGGVVAYDNSLKFRFLGVQKSTLSSFGAVSEQTVQEMIQGAIACTGSDIAVAASGIAGPTGGTDAKPVGTIWIAVGSRERTVTRQLSLKRNRTTNMDYTAVAALDLVRRFLRDV